uniref:probably inactive leucine-rich repeat receptor-like protein kinase At5g48380 n=1 Tax=Erigeron canadensis TaxID=72917 RepID=UPI001CB9C538|nr:probably inactive leucine-rich repeat receptor-like protein kinase At5g48380 [Erigeron canadensis]
MSRICIIPSLYLHMLLILACFALSNAVQSDIDCLRSIKKSLQDTYSVLVSWDFSNEAEGFICRFTGVECWHIDESRVMNLRLSDIGLRGAFPLGLKNCTSLTTLDLSRNQLQGPLPTNLTDVIPFVSSLDLSYNSFSGPIPPSLANCSFINILKLNNNHLTGEIPPQLGGLNRLSDFSVANNRLSGPVPYFYNATAAAGSYINNLGLCGGPLSPCKNDQGHTNPFNIIINFERHIDPFIFGFQVGFTPAILSTLLMFFFFPRGASRLSISLVITYHFITKKILMGRRQRLIEEIFQIQLTEDSGSEESKVTAMEKYIRRMSLEEIEMATNNFDIEKVIGRGNMGLMYKAMLSNGLLLAVKRLHKFESFKKEFLLEIEILGRLRHTNLVPLLAFCFEMEKKFLVYKYMSNRTLHQWLHCMPQVEGKKMGWTLRFRIAIGIARGLAWLHHNNVLRVAHCKINSNCILLDDEFEPKISNFGNSKILMNTSGIPSSCCNFVVPEFSLGPYKEDVYSFGIVLLELISGREPSTWINSSTELYVIDGCLAEQGFDEEIYGTLRIAKNCIRVQNDRELSMLQVHQAMCAISKTRNEISVD